ncbi:unnamed protein product [Mortierella alpina]
MTHQISSGSGLREIVSYKVLSLALSTNRSMAFSKSRYPRVLVLAAMIASTSLLALTSAQRDCGKNEVYNSCGSACPITCDNINNMPRICTLNCVQGCYCAPGLLRRRDGQCVKEFHCKASTPAPDSIKVPIPASTSVPAPVKKSKKSKKCRKNEVYRERKTICERSCEDPKSCSKNRKAGCFCRDGLLRTSDGLCVRKQLCKKTTASKPKTKASESKA